MERTVQVFEKKTHDLPRKKRVAAYVTVTTRETVPFVQLRIFPKIS